MNHTLRHTVRLEGCTATPLANYLKALGIFRVIAEQADPAATAWWEGDMACLHSQMDEAALRAFFSDVYSPTPVIAPWNGGSGFHPKEDQTNLNSIQDSGSKRFQAYGIAIAVARDALNALEMPLDNKEQFKAKIKDTKGALLQYLRNNFSEQALAWLDAVALLTNTKPLFPPILGSGGNDGRLDFTTNFMQRLDTLIDFNTGASRPDCRSLLGGALFNDQVARLPRKKAIGQFYPGAAGGVNMACAYEADPVNNSWDYVLMIEGALLFAASSTKRLNSEGQEALSYPFCVRTSCAAYGSAASSDAAESRDEIWAPLWQQPAPLHELKALLSEGRVQVGRKRAVRGVDFARAIATLGTDRGIDAFQRFGFQQRNGLAYLAVDLGRWYTRERRSIQLLKECEVWVERFRRCAKANNTPNSFSVAVRHYDEAVMSACRAEGRLTAVLTALGAMERTIIHSPGTATDNYLAPLPKLSLSWIDAVNDGSVEFRLACSLASIQRSAEVGALRANMIPCNPQQPWKPYDSGAMKKPHVVWRHGNLVDNLLGALQRRCMDAVRHRLKTLPLYGACPAALVDVLAFIRGDVDEHRINALLWGLNALDWKSEALPGLHDDAPGETSLVPPCYALLKLTHGTVRPDGTFVAPNMPGVPFDPAILALAAAGRSDATRTASRRLRASGWKPLVAVAAGAPEHIRRCAAAVLFPLSPHDVRLTARAVMRFSSSSNAVNRTATLSTTDSVQKEN